MRRLDKYIALASINIQRSLTYRIPFFMSLLASLIQIFVMYYIWMAVFKHRISMAGFNVSDMITYLIISQGLNNVYGWYNATERNISGRIRTGDIALDLIRPIDFNMARFSEGAGMTVLQVVMVALVLAVVGLFVPQLRGPKDFLTLVIFIVSCAVGFINMFSLSLMAGLLSFWTLNYWGLYYTKKAIFDFLSGALIPLQFLPAWLISITDVLPFKNIVYVPTMIYLGKMPWEVAYKQLVVQVVWAVMLWVAAKLFFSLAIRKVTVHGG